jgi:hypothetical protein
VGNVILDDQDQTTLLVGIAALAADGREPQTELHSVQLIGNSVSGSKIHVSGHRAFSVLDGTDFIPKPDYIIEMD